MSTIKTALIQQTCTDNRQQTMDRTASAIAHAARSGATLIVLQELHCSLYFCQQEQVECFDLAEPIPGPSTARNNFV